MENDPTQQIDRCRETGLKAKLTRLWHYFTPYEKIWFFSILVLAVIFSFLFPETDDPTYTVTLSPTNYSQSTGSFSQLNFTGIKDDIVITAITVNGTEINLGYDEFTVSPTNSDSLIYTLPTPITSLDTLEIQCYADGETTVFPLNISNTNGESMYNHSIDISTANGNDPVDKGDYTIVENPLNYIVPVQIITILYLLDVITNIACELLISKQSKWNFIVSLAVEIIEILICILCAYRFATLATTLLFWIPCDIISFVVWNRHRDSEQQELTEVKKLSVKQDILLVAGIIIWTVVVGYGLTFIDVPGGIFANNIQLKNIVCYIDACASAVGIANGVFILLRYREQWIAWYICSALETVINILAGQWILLVLKVGYLTNTTYGYIKWTKYIREHKKDASLPADTPATTGQNT